MAHDFCLKPRELFAWEPRIRPAPSKRKSTRHDTVPGDGMVDFAAVFRELPGYAGWVVVEAEQDPDKAHPLTYARMGHAHLVRILTKTGFTPATSGRWS